MNLLGATCRLFNSQSRGRDVSWDKIERKRVRYSSHVADFSSASD